MTVNVGAEGGDLQKGLGLFLRLPVRQPSHSSCQLPPAASFLKFTDSSHKVQDGALGVLPELCLPASFPFQPTAIINGYIVPPVDPVRNLDVILHLWFLSFPIPTSNVSTAYWFFPQNMSSIPQFLCPIPSRACHLSPGFSYSFSANLRSFLPESISNIP